MHSEHGHADRWFIISHQKLQRKEWKVCNIIMVTSENLGFVLRLLDGEQIQQCHGSEKEYVLISLHICNAFFTVTLQFTDDLEAFEDEEKEGNLILEREVLLGLLETIEFSSKRKGGSHE
ncbi:hypothetical protein [Indibacter alkaliphilus]|nr:hypothetical protein [Indibacter alkaliphilus]